MARMFDRIEEAHRAFIAAQHVFFVASAAAGARVNLSPKGLETLRVLDANTVCYLDCTGSGNETAAHLKADGRMTIMVCAFEGPPMILRLYGRGEALPRGGAPYAALLAGAFGGEEIAGARQIVRMAVDSVQTSCGYAVPLYAYEGQRDTLIRWAGRKGEDGLAAYRAEKNARSIDGLPAGPG
jgi:Pyridoxamine 5'-phosphate oxidase